MANQIGVLFLLTVLIFEGIQLSSSKECKYDRKYVCGIQDCNCRYVGQNGVTGFSSIYKRLMAMISNTNNEEKVCDKCEIFCSKEKHINCHHGACDKQKGCICRDCWSGETCSKYHNNQPEFKQSLYLAEIKEDANVGDEIFQVSAMDPDMEACVDKDNCPCGRVKYSIKKGNNDGIFNINSNNGVISLARKIYDRYDSISFTIVAENQEVLSTVENNPVGKAVATVIISVQYDESENIGRERRSLSHHHRARRSVTVYDSFEVIFKPETNETFFAGGSKINFRLFLGQNASASPQLLSTIKVKLSSENLELGTNEISVNISGSLQTVNNIQRSNSDTTLSFEPTGTLNAGGNDYIEIKFYGRVRTNSEPLALLQVAFNMTAGSVIYGPKFSTEIYTIYPEIKFARSTAGDVLPESTLDYNVNITLPYFNFTFIFEITTNVNDFRFLSIENVQLGEVSSSVDAENKNPTPVMYTGADDNITSRVVLDFGKITVLNTDQSANTMKFSFSVKVNDHHLLENASTHWIGAGALSGEAMLWVGQDAITISKDEPYLFAEIEALNSTSPTRYRINDVLRFSWIVKHAKNGSYENASNVRVVFYFSTAVKWRDNGAASGVGTGGTSHSSTDGGRKVLKFSKTGPLSLGDQLTGIIEVIVKDSVTALADLNVEIKIHYQTTHGEDRPVKTYKPNPGYLAAVPSFNLTSNVPDRFVNIGKVVEITVQILISKIKLEGKLYVILPVQNSSAIMRFIPHESFTTRSHGSNILVNATFTNAKAIYNSTTNDTTYYDRAEIDLGEIKNRLVTDAAVAPIHDNTVTLAFKAVLEDNDYVANLSSYKIGVGVKGSENMVWISQLAFIAKVSADRRPRLLIETNSNASADSLVQGSIVEYNFTISHKDDSDAHAVDVEVVWMLPTYTKYLQINEKSHNQMTVNKLQSNVVFKLSMLEFGETPSVSFSVALDPDKKLKKGGKNYAVTPVALSYKNKLLKTYFEPLIPVSVHFIVAEHTLSPAPLNAVDEFYKRGFFVDSATSAIYICSLSSKRNKPSCFWTNSQGATWRAVDVMVISIIGIDNAKKCVYGVGNNMLSYMKYIPDKGKWYSISRDHWEQVKPTLSGQNVKVEDSHANTGDPEVTKQKDIANGKKWGANKIGVYLYSGSSWQRKALWNCCN